MDREDHKSTATSTGHEIHGVHLCHRCGWPFPNPHPSARHRRAHKKVCGKLEGYKLIEPEAGNAYLVASDEEHGSDEDHQTPSPKGEEKHLKDFDISGGAGERLNKSEDEVFADAVTEFSDSGVSPRLKKRLESSSSKRVEKETELKEQKSSSSQTRKLECTTNQLESIESPSDTTAEAISFGVTNDLQSNVTNNKTEDAERKLQQDLISAEQFIDAKSNNDEAYLKSLDSVTLVSEEGKASDVNVIIVDREEEPCYKLISEVIKHELPSQKETPEDKDASAEVKKDSVNSSTDSELVEACKSEAGKEKMHLLSPKSPGIDNPEITIEDFKDQKYFQSKLPLDPSSAEITKKTEADNEDAVFEDDNLSGYSAKPAGNIDGSALSSSDFSTVEDNLKVESVTVEDNLKVETDTSTLRATSGSVETNGLEVREVTGAENHKSQTNCSAEGLQSHSIESSQNALFDNSPVNHCDTISNISSNGEEVKQETDVHGGQYISNCDINQSDRGVTVGNEGSKVDSEYIFCVESKTSTGLPDKSFAPKNDKAAVALVEDSNHCEEKSSSISGASNGSGEVRAHGSLTSNAEAKNGYSTESLDQDDFPTSDISSKLPISVKLAALPTDSESLKQNSTEENSSSDDGIMGSVHVRAAEMRGELNHDGTAVVLRENQVYPSLKEQETLPASQDCSNETSAAVENPHKSDTVSSMNSDGIVSGVKLIHEDDTVASRNSCSSFSAGKELGAPTSGSEILDKTSATVDETHITNIKEVSEIRYEPLQDEADYKLTKQKDGNSLVFVLGASSSPTESLEGNWGSVVSSQSDITTIAETNPVVAEKAHAQTQKHETVAAEGRPGESDDFEPPSFGTLVRSADKVEGSSCASEIEIAQHAQQPKSEALPEGWFPSITNVVNESEGRKKNEEVIAKVTNWSSVKQHSPLKNLLSEAKSPNPKQVPAANEKHERGVKDNGTTGTNVQATLGSGAPNKDMEEWNSPARYPVEIKKEKKKGKPYWVPFVCCS